MVNSLIDRSKIAQNVGGPKTIRKLPKIDRLKLGIRIADELGRKDASKRCAEKVVEEYTHRAKASLQFVKKDGMYDESTHRGYHEAIEALDKALEFAKKAGLDEVVKEIAAELVRLRLNWGEKLFLASQNPDPEIYNSDWALSCRMFSTAFMMFSEANIIAEDNGLEELRVKAALRLAERIMVAGQMDEFTEGEEFRFTLQPIPKEMVKEVAINALAYHIIKKAQGVYRCQETLSDMNAIRDDRIAHIADKADLGEEGMKEAALVAFERTIREGDYALSMKIAKEYRLDEQYEIAKTISDIVR